MRNESWKSKHEGKKNEDLRNSKRGTQVRGVLAYLSPQSNLHQKR